MPKVRHPFLKPDSLGQRTTPSVVAITEDGTRLVGDVAKRQVSKDLLAEVVHGALLRLPSFFLFCS
jgi:molecular chaperone DnaK (HSP70)